jgi:CHAT domain-containing protein
VWNGKRRGTLRTDVRRAALAALVGLGLALPMAARAADEGPASAPSAAAADAARSRGEDALRRGDFPAAAASLRESARLEQALGRHSAQREALLRLAEAQQALGAYIDAAASLRAGLVLAEQSGDAAQIARVRGALGNLYLAIGEQELARRELDTALSTSKAAGAPGIAAVAQNNLGNLFAAQGDAPMALAAYAQALQLALESDDPALAARVGANAGRVEAARGRPEAALLLLEPAEKRTRALPVSFEKAYLLINLSRSFDRIREARPEQRQALMLRSHSLLVEADAVATAIGDGRSASYALGYLGALYAEEGRSAEALELTRRAIQQAERADADESRYLWHAQSGRLLKGQGQRDAAIAQYTKAIEIVESLRHALAAESASPQTSFRESLGPLYFELVDLLLQRAAQARDGDIQADLLRAQKTVELLKAAELRNYFRDECVDAYRDKRKNVAEASASAAIVYPILLPDRIELLLSTSQGMQRTSVPVPARRVQEEVQAFRRLLEKRTTRQYLASAQQLHRWLIEPIEPRIAELGARTLVFVPDASLRTIPMSALHDGKRFLIEKFAVAVTPGLELVDPGSMNREKPLLFLGGLSESVQGFPALDHVPEELRAIQSELGGEVLLDESFALGNIEKRLETRPYNVVHIASHAEFEPKASDTFLLTHDGRMSMDQLASYVGLFKFRERPLELIMLSACETAQGDDQAALGLAGVAIKAGARSAVGTLWKVNDVAASMLVAEFYRRLRDPQVSRAVALQDAQRTLLNDLRYRHPGYWSAFVLISDWL